MIMHFLCRAGLGMALAVSFMARAPAMTVPDLQRLLHAPHERTVKFQEVHESPWLKAPVKLSGVMYSDPPMLEKRVESPRQETWRLYPDRMEWTGSGGIGYRQILFSKAPQLAALANAIRAVVSGDLQALTKIFDISLSGTENQWSAKLKPRHPGLNQQPDSIEFSGSGSQVRTIVFLQREHERTTIRLTP
jgi:hypothetical protein